MLSELTIQDLAIIDHLPLRFAPGFNVLTGETGAGKSIIIDAVALLLGGRSDSDMVRAEAQRAHVEGVFLLDGEAESAVAPLLERDDLQGDTSGILVLAREVRREGRTICRVNGHSVSLKALKELGEHLVDIHGQSEHLSLLRVREHVDLLDRFGQLGALRDQVAEGVRRLRSVRRELADLRRDERELARRIDLLQFQTHEIEAARLVPGEEVDLAQERSRLANAEQLTELAEEAYRTLFEGGDEQASALDLVQAAGRSLAALIRLDSSARAMSESAESAAFQLEDLAHSLRDYRDRIEFNPARLEQVEERLALIRSLQRKYGDTIPDVWAYAQRARRELDTIEHSAERIEALEIEEDRLLHQIGRTGKELSVRRREAAQRLSLGIEAELNELSMAGARFGVEIEWRQDPGGAYVEGQRVAFEPSGLDAVEFLVAPNLGEPLKPLVRIASGGETSRLMLALKTVLAHADRTPTLIFDEIDAGIGGRVGAVVGRKLWGLTLGDVDYNRRHQVLCVTHLPQLACYGDLHIQVRKGAAGDRTVTAIRALERPDREEELASMLGALTEQTRASAREMLEMSLAEKAQSTREAGI